MLIIIKINFIRIINKLRFIINLNFIIKFLKLFFKKYNHEFEDKYLFLNLENKYLIKIWIRNRLLKL